MRVRWVKEWDSNTKLFHGLVGNRRNKNSICSLERKDGSTVENLKEIKRELVRFHKKIFMEDEDQDWSFDGINWCALSS